jgi:hypothetical protein
MERTGGPAGLPILAGALNQEKLIEKALPDSSEATFSEGGRSLF